jgi:ribosomal protein S18 acetylase RimI-like enzyme
MMSIRPATVSDVEELSALINRAYRAEGAQAGWTNESWLIAGPRTNPAGLLRTLTEGRWKVLLLLRETALIGCIAVEPIGATTWYLSLLAIDPQYQAGGYGRLLLSEAEGYVRARGADKARMTVIQLREDLVAWYERRGYQCTGATEPFPYGDESVGTPTRSNLHFLVLEKSLSVPLNRASKERSRLG